MNSAPSVSASCPALVLSVPGAIICCDAGPVRSVDGTCATWSGQLGKERYFVVVPVYEYLPCRTQDVCCPALESEG